MRSPLRQLRDEAAKVLADEWPFILAMLGAGWACWAYYTLGGGR